jgi:hypothetical protein
VQQYHSWASALMGQSSLAHHLHGQWLLCDCIAVCGMLTETFSPHTVDSSTARFTGGPAAQGQAGARLWPCQPTPDTSLSTASKSVLWCVPQFMQLCDAWLCLEARWAPTSTIAPNHPTLAWACPGLLCMQFTVHAYPCTTACGVNLMLVASDCCT